METIVKKSGRLSLVNVKRDNTSEGAYSVRLDNGLGNGEYKSLKETFNKAVGLASFEQWARYFRNNGKRAYRAFFED